MYKETKIICSIATMATRTKSFNKVLTCLNNQTIKPNQIYYYNNDENEFNATDNGKFYYFETEESKNEEVIFLSMDDDIHYPPTYIEDMISALEKYNYNKIITHHGRRLNGKDLHYYRGHTAYACLHNNEYEGIIDVAGTGVTAFHTGYFKPNNIFTSTYKRMSDCVFSLEAAKQNKDIIILKHKAGYLKDICDDNINSCHSLESSHPVNQINVCNEIYDLNYNSLPKVTIIIPYVKDRGYLQEAIDSVNNQDYKGEIELILSQSENRVGYNLNRGIEKATGEYIKYLCDDDILPLDCISKSIKYFLNNKNILWLHGNATNFYDCGKNEIHIPKVQCPNLNNLLNFNVIHGGTLMYNKVIFEKYGMFDETLNTAEEYDFNLMLLSNNINIGYCNENLYLYRRHSMQKSIGNMTNEYQRMRRTVINNIIKKYKKR